MAQNTARSRQRHFDWRLLHYRNRWRSFSRSKALENRNNFHETVVDIFNYKINSRKVQPSNAQSTSRNWLLTIKVVQPACLKCIAIFVSNLHSEMIVCLHVMKLMHLSQNQVRREIRYALTSMPLMGLPTCALFLLEVRGYSQLYDRIQDASYGKFITQCDQCNIVNDLD